MTSGKLLILSSTKINLFCLLYLVSPRSFSSASDKAELFAENFFKSSNYDDPGTPLPAFLSRLCLRLNDTSVTPNLVKEAMTFLDFEITIRDFSMVFSPNCNQVVVLNTCEHELSCILAELFNIYVMESCFPDSRKALSVFVVFKIVWEGSTAKSYRPVSLISVDSKIFEKLVNNSHVVLLKKCSFFPDFKHDFRSFYSTTDFLRVVSYRVARDFTKSGTTQVVAHDTSKVFDRV